MTQEILNDSFGNLNDKARVIRVYNNFPVTYGFCVEEMKRRSKMNFFLQRLLGKVAKFIWIENQRRSKFIQKHADNIPVQVRYLREKTTINMIIYTSYLIYIESSLFIHKEYIQSGKNPQKKTLIKKVFGFLSAFLDNLDLERIASKIKQDMTFKTTHMDNLDAFLSPLLQEIKEHFTRTNLEDLLH